MSRFVISVPSTVDKGQRSIDFVYAEGILYSKE